LWRASRECRRSGELSNLHISAFFCRFNTVVMSRRLGSK